MEVRERIRLLRAQRGLKSKDLAERIGVSRPQYSLLEGGKRRLRAMHVEKIARALKVSVADLYGEGVAGTGKAAPVVPRRAINVSALTKRLKPVLGDQAEDAVMCLLLWMERPEGLRKALQAFQKAEG